MHNLHITDLREINLSISEVGFHTVKDNLMYVSIGENGMHLYNYTWPLLPAKHQY